MISDDQRLSDYLHDELPSAERAALDRELAANPDLRAELAALRTVHAEIRAELAAETGPEPRATRPAIPLSTHRAWWRALAEPRAVATLTACAVALACFLILRQPEPPSRVVAAIPEPAPRSHPKSEYTLRLEREAAELRAFREKLRAAEVEHPELKSPSAGARAAAVASAKMNTLAKSAAPAPTSASGFGLHEITASARGSAGGSGGGTGTGIGAGRHAAFFGASTGEAPPAGSGDRFGTEGEQDFINAAGTPLSTFSVDVNTASYAYLRRMLRRGARPAPSSVRIEELLNHFDYTYPEPEAPHPVGVSLEGSDCPWAPGHKLVRIGLRAKSLHAPERPPCNLVFLIDTSGSMNSEDKLPLVQSSLLALLERLDERDRVGIVTYAGASGVLAEPTPCDLDGKKRLALAIHRLSAGGSTAGAAGLTTAYELAAAHHRPDAISRVILATDGDFNVGVTSTAEIVTLAQRHAAKKTYLTVLGFGTGNLNDALMKQLSVKADGNHHYIDSPATADRILGQKLTGTLIPVAREVKIQVDFNPARVAAYRLLGYDTRRLANEDFNDDKKDAGEMGAGHTVTALYEIIPVGMRSAAAVDPSRYLTRPATGDSADWLTAKVRYQPPAGGPSTLLETPLRGDGMRPLDAASPDHQFAVCVAEFGLVLHESRHKANASLDAVLKRLAAGELTRDHADRTEFPDLVRRATTARRAN